MGRWDDPGFVYTLLCIRKVADAEFWVEELRGTDIGPFLDSSRATWSGVSLDLVSLKRFSALYPVRVAGQELLVPDETLLRIDWGLYAVDDLPSVAFCRAQAGECDRRRRIYRSELGMSPETDGHAVGAESR